MPAEPRPLIPKNRIDDLAGYFAQSMRTAAEEYLDRTFAFRSRIDQRLKDLWRDELMAEADAEVLDR